MGRLGGWVKKKVKNVEKREEMKEVETLSEKKATESKKKIEMAAKTAGACWI